MKGIKKLDEPPARAGPAPDDFMCQWAMGFSGLNTQDPSSLLLES